MISDETWDGLAELSWDELRTLVYEGAQRNGLLGQIVRTKIAFKRSKKDVASLKAAIDEALAYERPKRDPDWGKYDDYLHEIKKSILSLRSEISVPELKTVLIYLKERAESDEVAAKFDECGEWGLAIDDIGEHLLELEK